MSSVGKPQSAMSETLEATVPYLPTDRPRHLVGVGAPSDLVGAALRAVDMSIASCRLDAFDLAQSDLLPRPYSGVARRSRQLIRGTMCR
jgi:hypothetical protein